MEDLCPFLLAPASPPAAASRTRPPALVRPGGGSDLDPRADAASVVSTGPAWRGAAVPGVSPEPAAPGPPMANRMPAFHLASWKRRRACSPAVSVGAGGPAGRADAASGCSRIQLVSAKAASSLLRPLKRCAALVSYRPGSSRASPRAAPGPGSSCATPAGTWALVLPLSSASHLYSSAWRMPLSHVQPKAASVSGSRPRCRMSSGVSMSAPYHGWACLRPCDFLSAVRRNQASRLAHAGVEMSRSGHDCTPSSVSILNSAAAAACAPRGYEATWWSVRWMPDGSLRTCGPWQRDSSAASRENGGHLSSTMHPAAMVAAISAP